MEKIKKILCYFRIHNWRETKTYWREQDGTSSKFFIVSRYCKRCPKTQTLKDKWIDTEKLSKQINKSIENT